MPLDIVERPEGDRLKAFELYLSASSGGKVRSLRSIASELGVSAMTIGRWRDVDKWDEKIKKILSTTASTAESTSQAVKRRVRKGLLDGLDELQSLAVDPKVAARDRIAAIKAISDIALKIDAVTSGAFGKEAGTDTHIEFSDELESREWPETSARPLKPDVNGESSEESSSLTPTPGLEPASLLPSSGEALESLPAEEALALIEDSEQTT